MNVEHSFYSRATPEAAPLPMPTQDLSAPGAPTRWRQPWQTYLARLMAFGGAAALTVYGYRQMSLAFGNETTTFLQGLLLCFFTITFGWIALSATQALAALFRPRLVTQSDEDDLPLATRTAIIMPVYNEDPSATCAALQAMGEDIVARGEGSSFEIFILSDTTDPDVWVQETACFDALRKALGAGMKVWYRRRPANTGRKAGNLREFIEGWGARYDHMIVLDADSLMTAETIVALARRMQAEPRLGILQTVPILMGGTTLFARVQQFAGRVYGPIIARGVSAWQGLDGNYWGHNAIIRVSAFAEACGMPELSGRKPFGGHVLSHDFVEAALIRKGGYMVRMDTDLQGSWEGSPPTLLDLAARDRRWAQGNLQHAKIVGARGLAASNRVHFLIGIGSYLMSTVWLMMLVTGGLLTAQSLVMEREYFGDELQLFPLWPVFESERLMWLLVLSMVLLFLPKIVGALRTIFLARERRAFGGTWAVLGGAMAEILLSALLAPVLMFFQAQQLVEILRGKDSGWSSQSRNAEEMSWRTAFENHGWHVAIGLAALIGALIYAPNQAIWIAPMAAGLILAPVLSRGTGRVIDSALFRHLSIPEDRDPPPVALRARALRGTYRDAAKVDPALLMQDKERANVHIATLPPRPAPTQHSVDLDKVTAAAKLRHAETPEQAIGWLTKNELLQVLSCPELLLLSGKKIL